VSKLAETNPEQVLTELAFYLWRVRFEPDQEWLPEMMFNGSEKALTTIRDVIHIMRDEFKTQRQSTRKFLCNPPEDMDVLRYARENNAEIEWQIWLVLRMDPDVPETTTYEVKNKAVTVRLTDQMAVKFIHVLDDYLRPGAIHMDGLPAPGNLFLARDWLGIEVWSE
jgi:hypothetical protein